MVSSQHRRNTSTCSGYLYSFTRLCHSARRRTSPNLEVNDGPIPTLYVTDIALPPRGLCTTQGKPPHPPLLVPCHISPHLKPNSHPRPPRGKKTVLQAPKKNGTDPNHTETEFALVDLGESMPRPYPLPVPLLWHPWRAISQFGQSSSPLPPPRGGVTRLRSCVTKSEFCGLETGPSLGLHKE